MDLETALRLLDRRWVFGLAATAFLIFAVGEWGGSVLYRIDVWRNPPAAPASQSPLAADLLRDVQARESAKLRGVYRSVSAELAAARARGHDVAKLQSLADSALKLDKPNYRNAAIERLNKLRLVIPQRKEAFRPANADDLNPESETETPTPRAKGRRAR
jgi:hypothetical protein